jgi:hypothetical protein
MSEISPGQESNDESLQMEEGLEAVKEMGEEKYLGIAYQAILDRLSGLNIKQLTTIEAFHLKKILGQVFEQYKKDKESHSRKKSKNIVEDETVLGTEKTIGGSGQFHVNEETLGRWLFEMYGIDPNRLHELVWVLDDEKTGEHFEFKTRQEMDVKGSELFMKGHETKEGRGFPQSFINEIEILRREAHTP